MARCKLTRMSLRNIRKDKQYQCIVIDFVRTGVIGKSKAEELLGYTIPAGLLGDTTPADDDEENGGETPTKRTFTVVPWHIYVGGCGDTGVLPLLTIENGSQKPVVLQVEASDLEELTNKIIAAVNEACSMSVSDSCGNIISGSTGLGETGHTPADAIEYCTVGKYDGYDDFETYGIEVYATGKYTIINPQPADLDSLTPYIDSYGVTHVIISATEGGNA